MGHAFTVCIRTGNQNQASLSPFGPHEISVLIELTLGHRACLVDGEARVAHAHIRYLQSMAIQHDFR